MSDLPTDARALRVRIDAHDRFSAGDLDAWILGVLRPRSGERVLDAGCGTGKQSLALGRRVPGVRVLGVDASAVALAEATRAAAAEGLDCLRFREGRLEALEAALAGEPAFDAMLCAFALYYAPSPRETLEQMRRHLAPGGRVFVCGPARGNNQAFVSLCDAVVPRAEQPHRVEASLAFMEEEGARLFAAAFEHVGTFDFENPMTFPDPEDVVRYWRSYHLYSPGREDAFRRAVLDHFERHGRFVTVKRVRGALLS